MDCLVLRQQRLARAGHGEHQQPVLEHAFRQKPVAGAQRVQEQDVVRAFADRVMELDVDLGLVVEIAGAMRLVHARHDAVEQRQVLRRWRAAPHIRRLCLRSRGGIPDSRSPPCDAVEIRSVTGLVNSWPMMSATWVPPPCRGRQQPAPFQRLQRVAQDRPRHVELACQLALARQPVAGAQHAFEDEALDLLHHLVGGARMLDPGKNIAQQLSPGT